MLGFTPILRYFLLFCGHNEFVTIPRYKDIP